MTPEEIKNEAKERGPVCQEMANVLFSELAEYSITDQCTIATMLVAKILNQRHNYNLSCKIFYALLLLTRNIQ